MLLATLALVLARQGELTHQIPLSNPNVTLQVRETRLDPPKTSPKVFGDQRWEFDYLVRGYGNVDSSGAQQLRVRVYSQQRKQTGDAAPLVARMVMQLWDRAFRRLKLDHPGEYNHGIVDYFLCYGGAPGGEQLFGEEILPTVPQPVKVNTIYIYQLSTFKDPVEMAREVAHEYGHAMLPPVGGFKAPEDWGSGYLGEKLFLRWIRDDLAKGRLGVEDAMGASLDGLDKWVKSNVDPLVNRAATRYPEPTLISEGQNGMDAFNGLALYVEATCPPSVFTKSLQLTSMRPPTDYPQDVVEAASTLESLTISVPENLRTKNIWIPLGKGKLSGATVIRRKNGWAEVAPLMPNIVIKNPELR